MKEKLTFKPRARLLLQLGDELIKNESIALLELVKNSYDADATSLNVTMNNVENPDKGTILIEDNGNGMDLDVIENVWMEPGSSYRRDDFTNLKKHTKKFHRAVLGEKGIGRFAVHKLGDVIELTSRKKGQKEVFLKIDWTTFESSKYLDNTPIDVEEREPKVFTENKTGTQILITRFRQPWTRGMIRDVYRSWNSLCSPFKSPESFQIKFETDKPEWLEGIMNFGEIKEYALYKFICEINGDKITKFQYEFQPYPTMKKLKPRKVTEKDRLLSKNLDIPFIDGTNYPSGNKGIGKIRFEGFIFDRDAKVMTLGIQDKKGFKEYLNLNGGIKVYKDGMRVYDYGEPGSDWLNLDIRRVNIPTFRISNNIVMAAVSLSREKSWDLKEKTNREGFINNISYEKFSDSILYALHLVEVQRNQDKDMIRAYYGPTPKAEPVISKINELKDTVNKKIKEKSLKDEISIQLEKIEKDYNFINETLLKSAGAGLSFSVVIHEAEKIVDELEIILKNNQTSRVHKLVKHLSKLLDGYTFLIRKSGKKEWTVKELVDQAIFNTEFRLDAHKTKLIFEGQSLAQKSTIQVSKNLIISSILNIIDNSIYWLEYARIKNKKIFIKCSKEHSGYVSIVIADNGLGFSMPTEEMVKPFVTGKMNGMGLGLHITKEVMNAHRGELFFPDFGEFDLPSEFKHGAIVCLAFKAR